MPPRSARPKAGNALYVIEVNPRGKGRSASCGSVTRFPGQAITRSTNGRCLTGQRPGSSKPARPCGWPRRASAFSEWLASNPYAAEVTPDALLGYPRGLPEIYGADQRPAKLEWMIRQAKSVAGR